MSGTVVRILSDEDYFDAVKRAEVEGIEDFPTRWITGTLLVFLADKCSQLLKVGCIKL